jgi:hypothetical protein
MPTRPCRAVQQEGEADEAVPRQSPSRRRRLGRVTPRRRRAGTFGWVQLPKVGRNFKLIFVLYGIVDLNDISGVPWCTFVSVWKTYNVQRTTLTLGTLANVQDKNVVSSIHHTCIWPPPSQHAFPRTLASTMCNPIGDRSLDQAALPHCRIAVDTTPLCATPTDTRAMKLDPAIHHTCIWPPPSQHTFPRTLACVTQH